MGGWVHVVGEGKGVLNLSAITILTLVASHRFCLLIQTLTTRRCHLKKCAKREKNFRTSCCQNPCYAFITIFCFAGASAIFVSSFSTFEGYDNEYQGRNRCEQLACPATDHSGCDVAKFSSNVNYDGWIKHKGKRSGKFCSKNATVSSEICGYMCKYRLIRH